MSVDACTPNVQRRVYSARGLVRGVRGILGRRLRDVLGLDMVRVQELHGRVDVDVSASPLQPIGQLEDGDCKGQVEGDLGYVAVGRQGVAEVVVRLLRDRDAIGLCDERPSASHTHTVSHSQRVAVVGLNEDGLGLCVLYM